MNGAQYGEDEILQSFFADQEEGFLVDVGAADGIDNSNTVRLLERPGWGGILIEPEPEQYAVLESVYENRENIQTVNCAVGSEAGELPFHVCEQVSTLLNSWKQVCIERHGVSYYTITVQVQTLMEILDALEAPEEIDFLSIDCEGMDREIIDSLDLSKYKPRLICLEGFGYVIPGYIQAFKTTGNSLYVPSY